MDASLWGHTSPSILPSAPAAGLWRTPQQLARPPSGETSRNPGGSWTGFSPLTLFCLVRAPHAGSLGYLWQARAEEGGNVTRIIFEVVRQRADTRHHTATHTHRRPPWPVLIQLAPPHHLSLSLSLCLSLSLSFSNDTMITSIISLIPTKTCSFWSLTLLTRPPRRLSGEVWLKVNTLRVSNGQVNSHLPWVETVANITAS